MTGEAAPDDGELDIYDDAVLEGVVYEQLAQQIREGHFDEEVRDE